MSYSADVVVFAKPTGALDPTQTVAGNATYLAPDPAIPEHYINVRLTNGAGYYTAGGTSISGGSVLTADQGAPNLISAAWPIKVTDGSSVLGSQINPFVVVPWSGTFGSSSLNPSWVTGTVWVASLPRISGTVALTEPVVVSNVVTVTGAVGFTEGITLKNPVTSLTANQGGAQGIGSPWPVIVVSGSDPVGTQTHPTWVTGSIYVLNQSAGGVSSVTTLTGSIVDLNQGGVPIGKSNPLWTTGSVGLSGPITGTVALARAVDVATMPLTSVTGSVSVWGTTTVTGTVHLADVSAVTGTVALARAVDVSTMPASVQGTPAGLGSPWPVILASGSDVVGTSTHPLWVTGSITSTQGTMPWTVTGSVGLTGPITGTVAIASAVTVNQGTSPWIITGSVHLTDVSAVTGTVALARGVDISTMPAVSQGTAGPLSTPWRVQLVSGSDVVGQTSNPLWVTGSVHMADVSAVTGTVALSRAVDVSTMPNLSVTNVVSVTGTIHMADVSAVTGTVALARGVDVSTLPAVAQGTAAALSAPWRVQLVSGSDVVGQASNPLWVTGSVHLADVSAVTGTVALARGVDISSIPTVTVNPHSVSQGTAAALGAPWPVLLVSGSDAIGTVSHPISITGSVSIWGTSAVTGAVALTRGVDISTLPAVSQGTAAGLGSPWRVQLVSGSDVVGQTSNPLWVTGSVYVLNSNVTALSGSVVGLLVGGVPVAGTNPLPITGTISLTKGVDVSSMPLTTVTGSVSIWGITSVTGTVHLADVSAVTGTVALARGVDISSLPTVTVNAHSVNQGTAAALGAPWPVLLVSGSDPIGTVTHPISITGSLSLTKGVDVSSMPLTTVTGSVSIWGVSSVTGTVHLADVSAVTGTVALARGVDIVTMPAITGSVSIWGTSTVTGTIALARAIDVATMPVVSVTGSVTLAASPFITTLSGSVVGQLVGGLPLSSNNPAPVVQWSATSVLSRMTASIGSQLVLVQNTLRRMVIIVNESTVATMYVKFGAAATTASYTYYLSPGTTLELPTPVYTGRIDALWSSGTGSAMVTETN